MNHHNTWQTMMFVTKSFDKYTIWK